MKPIRVTMSAFGSYGGETAVDFQAVDHGLFLVTGDTGAGKTTIFDAISFALFGELSGGARDGAMMRSQYAGEENETYVELIFSERGERYTVRRSPSYQRPSKRRNKDGGRTVTTVPPKAVLILPDGSEYPGRIGDVSAKIQEIVGVDRQQFTQIAMIAQGEYLKLLHASSKERKEIFSRIFDTGIYWRVQQKLREKNHELCGRLEDNRNLYEHEARQVLVPCGGEETAGEQTAPDLAERWECARGLLETRPQEIEELLVLIVEESIAGDERARRELEQVITRLAEQKNRLERVREKNRRLEALAAAEEKLSVLEREAPVWQEKKRKLGSAKRALPVRAGELLCINAEREWEERILRIGSLETELEALRQPCREADRELLEKTALLETERPVLAARLARIEEMLPAYEELERRRREGEKEGRRLAALRLEEERAEIALGKNREQRDGLQKEQANLEGSAAGLAEARGRLERLQLRGEELKALSESLDDLGRIFEERENRREQMRRRQASYERASASYEEKNHLFISVQAGILACGLEEGSPCPVCGSPHHPRKAELRAEDVTKEQVEEARGRRETADAALREALESYQELNARCGALERQASGQYFRLVEEKERGGPEIPGSSGAFGGGELPAASGGRLNLPFLQGRTREALETCLASVQAESARCREGEARVSSWEKNKVLQRSLEEEAKRLERLLLESRAAAAEAELLSRQLSFQLEQLEKNLPWKTQEEARRELENLTGRRDRLEREAVQARERAEQLSNSVREKTGYLASEREKSAEDQRRKTESRRRWQELWAEQGFLSEEEYRGALIPDEERERLQGAIEQYDSELLRAKTILEQCRELTQGEEREAPAEIEAAIQSLSEEKAALSLKSGRRAAVRTKNEQAGRAIRTLLKERGALREQKQMIETLYTTADGKVSRAARIDFQTYVQRQYFKQMAAAANKRLLPMTGGRFLLQCRELEMLGRQGEVGLDLDVYDLALDRTRDVKTLSGGESFIAALAMALGMADVIQSMAGRVNIEAMFIDEGFGSLDEESRGKAIRILKELAGSRRLVGIISHVTELKEQLDRKLIVRKTERGSTVRWEIES